MECLARKQRAKLPEAGVIRCTMYGAMPARNCRGCVNDKHSDTRSRIARRFLLAIAVSLASLKANRTATAAAVTVQHSARGNNQRPRGTRHKDNTP